MNLTAQILHGGCAAVFFVSLSICSELDVCQLQSDGNIVLVTNFFLEYTSDSDCSNIVLFVFWLSSNIFSDFKKRL